MPPFDENPEPFIVLGYRKLKEAFLADWEVSRGISKNSAPTTTSSEQKSHRSTNPPKPSPKPQPVPTTISPTKVKSSNGLRINAKMVWWAAGINIAVLLIFAGPISDLLTVDLNNSTPDIADIADNSGFNLHGKALFYRANPELVDANSLNSKCPNDSQDSIEFGCYLTKENKIYILSVSDQNYKDIEYTTAAHETLHAAWMQQDASTRQALSNNLNSVYINSTAQDVVDLRNTMKSYGTDKDTVVNELHSFVGSEIKDVSLNSYLIGYYGKYFSNRSAPIDHNDAFNGKIDTEISNLSSQGQQLDTSYNATLAYKSRWLDTIEGYMRQNEYYGDVYTYNENVDAYNHNLVNYNKMVDDYNARRNAYNAEVDKFNALLTSFRPTQAPIQANQQSIQ